MARIVISGSEGFIGKKLIKELKLTSDFNIECLDIVNGHDLCKPETIKNIEKFDIFIHLASLSYVPESFNNPKKFYDVNINSTLNILELCREYKAKLIYISSYVYGTPKYLPIDEDHPLEAFNPYAQTKIIGEKLCEGYYRDFGVCSTILRPFNIYGEGQNENFLLPSIIKQIKSGVQVIKLENPYPKRDFIHIDDVVKALILCTKNILLTSNSLKYYNIASGKSYSVLEITEIIKNLSDEFVNLKFEFSQKKERKNEVYETVGSYDKIKNEIGWEPSISIHDGLYEWVC